MAAHSLPSVAFDCAHERRFNLETAGYQCANCGADWETLKPKKTLYCAAFMVKTPRGWEADSVYMHCDSVEEARLQFYRSEVRMVREANVAPVVGYFADDENGDHVSV